MKQSSVERDSSRKVRGAPRFPVGGSEEAAARSVESRLLSLSRRELLLDRHAATCVRKIWESDLPAQFGYSHLRDFAREELGVSVKSCQEWVRLDRALDALPITEAALRSGLISKSKLQVTLPVLESRNEQTWLRRSVGKTVAGLQALVRAEQSLRKDVRSESGGPTSEGDPAGADKNVALRQRTPLRARLVWEAARDELSKRVGRPVSDGEAHELYLAEFWSGVPPEVRSRLQAVPCWPPKFCKEYRTTQVSSADAPAFIYSDPTVRCPSPSSCGPSQSVWDWARFGILPSQTDGKSFVTEVAFPWDAWKDEERRDIELRWLESRRDETRTDRAALDRIAERQGSSPSTLRRERTPREWFELYRRIDASRRRIRLAQGRLLLRMKRSRSYAFLGFSEFGRYVRERLGVGRKAADERVHLARTLDARPYLRPWFQRGRLTESHLILVRRLIGAGVVTDEEIHAWADRAGEVTVKTFEAMVRDALKSVALRTRDRDGTGALVPPAPVLPPTRTEWPVLSSESLRHPDATVTQSGRRRISARVEGGESDTTVPAFDPESLAAELVPIPSERAEHTTYVRAPRDVIESYQRAIALLRAVFGDAKPAWWCREVLVLSVRRHWAMEDRVARRRVERWDIYARDGFLCSAPGCTQCGTLMSHHIHYRSQGGPDTPENQTTVCEACHLHGIHGAGAVDVKGTAPHDLTWSLGDRHYECGGFRVMG